MAIVLIIPGAFESLRLVQNSMGNMEMCGHKHFCWKWGDRTTVMSTSLSDHVPNLTSICLMWDPALFHLSLARRMEFSKNKSSAIESMSSWTWMFFFSKINSRRLGAISNLRDRAFSNKLQFFTNILTFPAQFQTSLTPNSLKLGLPVFGYHQRWQGLGTIWTEYLFPSPTKSDLV